MLVSATTRTTLPSGFLDGLLRGLLDLLFAHIGRHLAADHLNQSG
jgi:hypothetical protein